MNHTAKPATHSSSIPSETRTRGGVLAFGVAMATLMGSIGYWFGSETNFLDSEWRSGFLGLMFAWLLLAPGLFVLLPAWWKEAQEGDAADAHFTADDLTPAQRAARAALFAQAFDAVLMDLMRIHQPHSRRDLNSKAAARFALEANAMHSGPVARQVEAHLLARGVSGVSFHSIKGHFVVVDALTGLMHDLEAYRGVARATDLPIHQRKGRADRTLSVAKAWVMQRQEAFQWPVAHGVTA